MKPDFLPESFLSKIAPADRRAIGRPARTASERQAANDVKLERELHKLISNELLRRGIFAIHSRCDKRTTNAIGIPDYCCCINFRAVAMEVKVPPNTLTHDQAVVRQNMIQNGWLYFVVYSFDEAVSVINSITPSQP